MAEKTEKATPKKLRDARKKGQVAKIQDLPAALTFIVSLSGAVAFIGYFYEKIASYFYEIFQAVPSVDDDFIQVIPSYFLGAMEVIAVSSFPLMVIVCCVGVLTSFLVIGPVFSMEAMKFNLKKLNPIEGIKQKFKLKVLVDLLKSIAKITGAAIIIYLIIKKMLPKIVAMPAMPILATAEVIHEFLISVVIQVGIFFLFIALFDLAFQKKNFAKEMMMEKFEVKQEYKDTEGDPMIKGRRREMFREIAYREGPNAARKARAIITNPTHIAVALRYNPEEEPAPIILTMGTGAIADKIIKVALEHKVPIMRNVELARELYTKGKISDYVPEETYKAIAEILKWIEALEENPDINVELFQ